MADKKITFEPDVIVEDEHGNIFDRAEELLRQLRDAYESQGGSVNTGAFILIFDAAPQRDGIGMITNLEHNASTEILEAMLEGVKRATN